MQACGQNTFEGRRFDSRLVDRCEEMAHERRAVHPSERVARRPAYSPAATPAAGRRRAARAARGVGAGVTRGESGDVVGVTRVEEVLDVDW